MLDALSEVIAVRKGIGVSKYVIAYSCYQVFDIIQRCLNGIKISILLVWAGTWLTHDASNQWGLHEESVIEYTMIDSSGIAREGIKGTPSYIVNTSRTSLLWNILSPEWVTR